MYHSSTQREYWTFKNDGELVNGRKLSNSNYRRKYCALNPSHSANDDNFFLTVNEERQLLRWYDEKLLKEFCRRFNPAMPMNCIGTSCHYVKRLYLRFSIMDYNPKLIMLASIWLACKTEEFNISMDQFVMNIHHLLRDEVNQHGEEYARKYGDAILAIELILIKELNFHLTVHNPFRAFEGLLIDIKTRYPNLENAEILRKPATDYLNSSIYTDAILLYAPSQIALACLLSAASKKNIAMNDYMTGHLLKDQPSRVLEETIKNVKSIRSLIKKNMKPPSENTVKHLEQKLERCRNKESDPLTAEYAQLRFVEDEERDRVATQRWREEAQRQRQIEANLLSF